MDVGLFWWYSRKMALDIIGFRQILIWRKTDMQVKHLAFLYYCWMGWNRVNS